MKKEIQDRISAVAASLNKAGTALTADSGTPFDSEFHDLENKMRSLANTIEDEDKAHQLGLARDMLLNSWKTVMKAIR